MYIFEFFMVGTYILIINKNLSNKSLKYYTNNDKRKINANKINALHRFSIQYSVFSIHGR